jgi:hypothetical protein
MKAASLVTGIVLAGAPCFAEPPTLTVGRSDVTLGRLPPVLAEREVARHLGTGLTTTLLFALEVPGEPALKGGAQVAVRFDLWDERYLADVVDGRGAARATLSSRDELERWWSGLVLPVLVGPPPPRGRKARVTLRVLPFSQAEQQDARDWLLRSIRASEPPAPNPARPEPPAEPARPRTPVRDFYAAMLASSIGRRSLITYSWTVPIREAP